MAKTTTNPTSPLTSTGAFFAFLLGVIAFVGLALAATGCAKVPEHASAMPTLPTLDLPAIQRVECGGQLVKTLLNVPHNVANGIKHAAMVGRPFTAVEAAAVIMVADEWARTRQCLGLSVNP